MHSQTSVRTQRFNDVLSPVWRLTRREDLILKYCAAIQQLFPGMRIMLWENDGEGNYRIRWPEFGEESHKNWPYLANPSPIVKKSIKTEKPIRSIFKPESRSKKYWEKIAPKIEAEFAIPLNTKFILNIAFVSKTDLSEADFNLLILSGSYFSSYYELLARLEEKNEQLIELDILNRVTSFLNMSYSVDEFFENLYQEVKRLFTCDIYYLGTYHKEKQEITLEIFVDEDFVSRKKSFPLKKLGFIRYVIEQKKLLLVKDLDKEINYLPIRPVLYGKKKNAQSWLGIPLIRNGEAIGIMAFASYKKRVFTEKQLPVLFALGQLITSILFRIQMQESIQSSREKYESLFQSLTNGVVLVDARGRIMEANRAFFQLFSSAQIQQGQFLEKIFSVATQRKKIKEKLAGEESFVQDFQFYKTSEQILYIKCSGIPLLHEVRRWLLWFDDQTQDVIHKQLLLTLYQNSFRIQQAKTEKQIFRVAVSGLKKSGYHTIMLAIDSERKVFKLTAHSFSREEFLAFPLVKKMLPNSIELKIDDFQALKQILETKEPVYRENLLRHLLKNYPQSIIELVKPGFEKIHLSRSLTMPILGAGGIAGAFVLFGNNIEPEDARMFQIFATSITIALERAHAQKEIEASEKKYRKTLEKAGTALFVTDFMGRIQSVNAAGRKLINCPVDVLCDHSIMSIVEEKDILTERLKRIENRGFSLAEVHFISKNGEVIPAALSATAFRVQNEKIVEWIAWDLRPQKRREAEISRKNKELETLYRIAGHINRSRDLSEVYRNLVREIVQLFQVDSVGIYFIGNDHKLHYRYGIGLSNNYIREIDLLEVGEGLAGWVAKHKKPLLVPDIGKDSRLTRRIVVESGFHSYGAVPIFSEKNVIGTLGVLTRRHRTFKQYEIKLLQTIANDLGIAFEKYSLTQQLGEASERYKHLFQDAFDGIVLLNLDDFRVVEINHLMAERFHLSPRNIENLHFPDLVAPDDYEKIISYLKAISGQNNMKTIRIRLRAEKGNEFIADINGGAMSFHNGHYGMLMIRDVTNQVELEDRLRLSEQLAAVGELSAGIAHEIRNPLSAINTATGLMKMNPKIPEEDSELLRIILEESKRLETVVSEFIQFARPQRPNFQKYSLKGIISDIIQMYNTAEPSLTIQQKTRTDPGVFYFDPYLIRQVLVNLIKNAIEAIRKAGRRRGNIVVQLNKLLANGMAYAQIRISDNGVGIPPEKMKIVFQPFFSTKESGLGMGLSISQKIIQQHDGFLTVESNAGKGSTFKILLPLKEV